MRPIVARRCSVWHPAPLAPICWSPTGGASVGDHDLVQAALGEQGMAVDFWKIAMRPGKPMMFGNIGTTRFIGLPGNPVSTLVCSLVFIRPALRIMLGQPADDGEETAIAGRDLAENDNREDYLRSSLSRDGEGRLVATPFAKQDSSMQFLMQQAQCLVIRPVQAPALAKGSSRCASCAWMRAAGSSYRLALAAGHHVIAQQPDLGGGIVQLALHHIADADDADHLAILHNSVQDGAPGYGS